MLDDLCLPPDITAEENMLIEIVKDRMLSKLDDRQKFIFLYCIEMGNDQRKAADILGCHETIIVRYMNRIRERLKEFAPVKIYE